MRVKTRLAALEHKIKHARAGHAGCVAFYDPRHPDAPPVVPASAAGQPITVLLPLKDTGEQKDE